MSACGGRFHCLAILVIGSIMYPANAILKPQDRPAARQIQVHTGEVVVDANVTNSGGKPVRGLAATDFEIYEDGVKQQITSFRYVSGNPQEKAAQQAEPAALSPSNPRLVCLVFDKVTMEASDARRAAGAANAYVTKFLGNEVMAGVFGIGSGIHTYQRFTSDKPSLLRAIQEATAVAASYPGDVSAEIQTALRNFPTGITIGGVSVSTDEDLIALALSGDFGILFANPALQDLRILLKFRDIDRETRGNRSMSGLLALVEALKIVPGRKSLILLSNGFTAAPNIGAYSGPGAEIRALAGAANLAGVTIFSLNTSGLMTQDPELDRQSAMRAASKSPAIVGPNTSLGMLSKAVGLNTSDNLQRVAEDTGGYYVSNSNDLASEMDRVGAYLNEYYILTYTPENLVQDGRFRAISVKLKRSGLKVSARRGFYAFSDTDRMPLTAFEAALLEAVHAKTPPAKLSIQIGGFTFPGADDTPTAALFVQFPLSQFQSERVRESGNDRVMADVMLLVKKADGSVVHRLSRQYDLEVPHAQPEVLRQKGFSFYRRVPLPNGDYILQAAVRDRISGNVSVRTAEFGVAVGAQQDLRISSIVLVSNPSTIFHADAGANSYRLEDPLLANGRNLSPDLVAAYRKSADKDLVVYFSAQTQRPLLPIQCTLDFYRDGAPALQLQRSLYDTAGRPIPCIVDVGLDQLAPGKYELRVTAKDRNGSISNQTAFVVRQ